MLDGRREEVQLSDPDLLSAGIQSFYCLAGFQASLPDEPDHGMQNVLYGLRRNRAGESDLN